MNQTNLDRAVARATGESVRRIRSMGFSIVPAPRLVLTPAKKQPRPKLRLATASR